MTLPPVHIADFNYEDEDKLNRFLAALEQSNKQEELWQEVTDKASQLPSITDSKEKEKAIDELKQMRLKALQALRDYEEEFKNLVSPEPQQQPELELADVDADEEVSPPPPPVVPIPPLDADADTEYQAPPPPTLPDPPPIPEPGKESAGKATPQ